MKVTDKQTMRVLAVELTEPEAELLASLCAGGVSWGEGEVGSFAQSLFYALRDRQIKLSHTVKSNTVLPKYERPKEDAR